jgi:2'-5' RNA ligase
MNFHKRACLVIPVTGPLRKAISEAAASTHRAGPNVEVEADAHVTIRYGIRNEDADTLRTLRQILSKTESFPIQFGELKTFPASESSEWRYPLVMRCESSDALTKLFKEVSNKIDCDKFTFDLYKPHITLAYLPTANIPVVTTESARELQGMFFPVYRADLWFRDGRRVPFPVGKPSERFDAAYSDSVAPNPGYGPQPVGESYPPRRRR